MSIKYMGNVDCSSSVFIMWGLFWVVWSLIFRSQRVPGHCRTYLNCLGSLGHRVELGFKRFQGLGCGGFVRECCGFGAHAHPGRDPKQEDL